MSIAADPVAALTTPSISVAKQVLPSGLNVELPLHRLSVADYERMAAEGQISDESRVELLEGVVVQISPKGIGHNYVIDQLSLALTSLLGNDWFVRSQSTLRLSNSEPEPDLVVLRGRLKDYRKRHPNEYDVGLIIEVAETSLNQDRATKGFIYAKHRLPEYWIVNLIDECVEIYRLDARSEQPVYLPPIILGKDAEIDVELGGVALGRISAAELFA